jgi:hypothetical protein
MICTACGHRGPIEGAAGQELRRAAGVVRTAQARIAAAGAEERKARGVLWRARLGFLPALLGWVLAPTGCAGIGASSRDWSTAILWACVAACGALTLLVVVRLSRRGNDDVIEGLSDDLDAPRGPKERVGRACKHCGAPLEASNVDAIARCQHCGADNALEAERVDRAYAPRVKAAAWVGSFVGGQAKEGAERIGGISFWMLPTAFFVPLVWAAIVFLTVGSIRFAGMGDENFSLVTLADGRRCVAVSMAKGSSGEWIDFGGHPPRGIQAQVKASDAKAIETITSSSLRGRTVTSYVGPTGMVLRVERELSRLDEDRLVIASAPDALAEIPGTCVEDGVR